jgi:hypothetical protein
MAPAKLRRTAGFGQKRSVVFLRLGVPVLIVAQIAFASLLIAASSSLVLLWLSLLALSYGGESGLMPWTGAGVILFGLIFVAIAAIVGVPGILWANNLARGVPPMWQRIAKAPGWIGSATLVIGFVMGFVAAIVALVTA